MNDNNKVNFRRDLINGKLLDNSHASLHGDREYYSGNRVHAQGNHYGIHHTWGYHSQIQDDHSTSSHFGHKTDSCIMLHLSEVNSYNKYSNNSINVVCIFR